MSLPSTNQEPDRTENNQTKWSTTTATKTKFFVKNLNVLNFLSIKVCHGTHFVVLGIFKAIRAIFECNHF